MEKLNVDLNNNEAKKHKNNHFTNVNAITNG